MILEPEKTNLRTFSSPESISHYRVAPYLKGYEQRVVEKYFKIGQKILDLGCGAGRTTKVLADRGYEVIGVDIAAPLIAIARELYPRIKFYQQSANQLQFPDGYFDLVFFSFNGLDYIYPKDKRIAAVKEINRVLKPGGIFIYTSHNKLSLPLTKNSLMTCLWNINLAKNYRRENSEMGRLTVYYGRLAREIKDLRSAGFAPVEISGVGRYQETRTRLILNLLSKHLVYVFRKQ